MASSWQSHAQSLRKLKCACRSFAVTLPWLQPRVLIFLGNVATAALLGRKEGISRLRGQWYDYHGDNGTVIKARPMFHPAYLLRSPLHKKLAWQDLCAITRQLETFRDS